jgi:uncharacterized membrane protein
MHLAILYAYAWVNDYSPHVGFDWPRLGLMFPVMLLFWLGLIGLWVWICRSFAWRRHVSDTTLEVLRWRFANGEISQEEYDKIRQVLQG